MNNERLGRTDAERYAETFGDTVSKEELDDARRQAAEMLQNDVVADFNRQWEKDLSASHVESLDRIIRNLPRIADPIPISENEQISRLTVIALKLGMPEAAELLRRFVDTEPGFNWDEITLDV